MENIVLELFQKIGAKEIKEEERQEYEEIIAKIVDLSKTARKEGLLGIEDLMNKESYSFLKLGLQLLIDENDLSIIQDVLCARIIADNYCDFMKRILMFQGVICIYTCDNPVLVDVRLRSFLGSVFEKDYTEFRIRFSGNLPKAKNEVSQEEVLSQEEIDNFLEVEEEK